MYIMQGDAYSIPVRITSDGEPVTPETAETVEITLGPLIKQYPTGISFSDGDWLFTLTQGEAFTLSAAGAECKIRVKFRSGDVIGVSLGKIDIAASRSKAVL